MRPLAALNEGKAYAQQLKLFNFLLTCHVRALGHPTGVDAERFHLIAPYESDPELWSERDWIDQYSGKARRGRRRPHAQHRALLIAYARRRGVLRRR